MVKLSLNNFKASGVYTIEYDQSDYIVVNSNILRLIVGFSRKGPFNSLVYLSDKKTARRIFGDIDDFLERRGSYFHRALFDSLDYGPVFALNLLKPNNDPNFGDYVPYQSFSLCTTEKNGKKVYKLLSSYYNKERFWFPDQSYLIGNANTPGSINKGKLLHIVNLSQNPVSILIRKANVTGFDITAREWFGEDNVPSYVRPDDYISDYFIEIIVISGNWTNYDKLSIDPIYSKYFTRNGIRKSMLNEFLGLKNVNVIGTFVGSIIPNLVDGNGVNHSIDVMVNNNFPVTGVFLALDKNLLENYDVKANLDDEDFISAVDMVGHNFANLDRENPEVIDFLSYRTSIKEDTYSLYKKTYDENDKFIYEYNSISYPVTSESYNNGTRGLFDNVLVIKKPKNVPDDDVQLLQYNTLKNMIEVKNSVIELNGTWNVDHQYGTINDKHLGIIDKVWVDYINDDEYLKILWYHPVKEKESLRLGYNIGSLYGNEVFNFNAVPDPDSGECAYTGPDANYVSLLCNLGLLNKYHLVINRPTTPGVLRDMFDELYNMISSGNENNGSYYSYIPKVGMDIMLKSSDSYYYIKISSPGLKVYQSDENDPSTRKIFIPLETNSNIGKLISNIKLNLNTYKVYFGSYDYVKATVDMNTYPTFIMKPNLIKFVKQTTPTASNPNYIVAYKNSKLFEYYKMGVLQDGDVVYYAAPSWEVDQNPINYFYVTYKLDKDDEGLECLKIQFYDYNYNGVFGYYNTGNVHGYNITPSWIRKRGETGIEWINRVAVEYDDSFIPVYENIGNYTGFPWYSDSGTNPSDDYVVRYYCYVYSDMLYDNIEIVPNSWNSVKTSFQVKLQYGYNIEVGDYIVGYDPSTEEYYMTRVVSKKKEYNDGFVYTYTTTSPVYIDNTGGMYSIIRYKPLEKFISNYQMFYLEGFKLTDYHLPGGPNKQQQLEKILSMLDPKESNLFDTLKDTDLVQFRYIIDTFDGQILPMTGNKRWITRLAKERQKCLAIMNLPSIKEFMMCNDPLFTEQPTVTDPKPILNTKYIAEGGNLSLGPSNIFSLPDMEWGASHCGYFSPFILIRENGNIKSVPPAPYIGNLFVRKPKPWSIVAGKKRGVLSVPNMVGLEYEFLLKDREYLEPAGINTIIKKNNMYMVFSNVTAHQRYLSALNNLHIRDLLITIEDEIEQILGNFLFEENTPTMRLQIKTTIESYLDNIRSQGGIYDYMVIMDDKNNPPEVIDRNMGIVDIAVEPVRGLQKFINRITIMKTGGISSGGFTVA